MVDMPTRQRWVLTTSGQRPLDEVRAELVAEGFAVEQVLEEIGCITGTASDDVVARARSIEGVADATPDHPIDIGPPDAPVTW